MKKTKTQSIILYSMIFILIGIIVLSNKDILKNTKIVLKNMDESTQIANKEKAIDDLNESYTEYYNYIQIAKKEIASAITEKGVETSNIDSLETMANNIKNIKADQTLYIEKLCDVTPSALSNYTVNIANYLPSEIYTKLTTSNFKLITNNGDFTFTFPYTQGETRSANYRAAYIVSYTPTTGKLVIYPGYVGVDWTQGRTYLKVSVICCYQK